MVAAFLASSQEQLVEVEHQFDTFTQYTSLCQEKDQFSTLVHACVRPKSLR